MLDMVMTVVVVWWCKWTELEAELLPAVPGQ